MGKYGKIKIYKYLYDKQNIYQLRTILPKKKRIGVAKNATSALASDRFHFLTKATKRDA